jgi:hypothetical protein
MKLEYSRQIFEKYPNIKFHENPSNGSRVVPCGRTCRHDEANSRFLQFCEGAQKLRWFMYLSVSVMQQYVSPLIIKMDHLIATIRELYLGRLCSLDLFWKIYWAWIFRESVISGYRSRATSPHTCWTEGLFVEGWLKAGIVTIFLLNFEGTVTII